MSFSEFDYRCMTRAIMLARKGWYTTDPNPRVGCVIAKDGEIVGEGYHHRAGEAHAEINALNSAGEKARGAVAYVTLEPCNHYGKTGPCATALIEAGVAEVVFAMADPHKVASGGIDTLKGAGISVRGPFLEGDARSLNPGFILRCKTGFPRVTVKLAMSLDGRTAMASGESKWITGSCARRDVQLLRARNSAVITGIGTVMDDDPAMTVRASELALDNAAQVSARQPLRVVVDSLLRTPARAKVVNNSGPVLIVCGLDELPVMVDTGFGDNVTAIALPVEGDTPEVDLVMLLKYLAEQGCNDVLVEAGPRLAGAFVARDLVDELVIYMAGKLMGSTARPLMDLPLDLMSEAVSWNIREIRAVGQDWRITATPEKR